MRPNAATANTARLDAAIAARDADALPPLVAESVEVVDHTTGGATYDGQGLLAHWRALLRARDPTYRHEPLATLGDSLALNRMSMSASGIARGKFDVGPYEHEVVLLIEVDAHGRRPVRTEAFAADRLSDAVARLYERYAELLPDGPARVRAAATARSVATMLGPPDLRADRHGARARRRVRRPPNPRLRVRARSRSLHARGPRPSRDHDRHCVTASTTSSTCAPMRSSCAG